MKNTKPRIKTYTTTNNLIDKSNGRIIFQHLLRRDPGDTELRKYENDEQFIKLIKTTEEYKKVQSFEKTLIFKKCNKLMFGTIGDSGQSRASWDYFKQLNLDLLIPYEIHGINDLSLTSEQFKNINFNVSPEDENYEIYIHLSPGLWKSTIDYVTEFYPNKTNITLIFVWELNVIPTYMIDQMKRVNNIIIPTKILKILLNNITCDIIKHTPICIDKPIEVKEIKKFLSKHKNPTIFYTIGTNNERKDLAHIIATFNKIKNIYSISLPINPPILIIKTDNKFKREYYKMNNVLIIDRYLTDREIMYLHDVSDVFINTSKAEGVCYPAIDAIANNKSIIYPENSPIQEYLKENTKFYTLKTTECNVSDNFYRHYPKGSKWNRVSRDENVLLKTILNICPPYDKRLIEN